ncbi:MAG: cellulase family glycosylhydrolase [Bacteroidales bacterium]|nr:cellulase family glycosylhydrolase [Bacteroidales bacterium]
MKGTNLGHWLSQSKQRGEERQKFIMERDIQFIDSLGFDHIRLPIDEEQMWDENEKRHEDAFALMQNCLEWSRKAGLRVIIDLHILRSHYFNAAEKPLWTKVEEQDKLIRLWKDLSVSLREWPNSMVAYEFMNEPVADDAEQWNVLLTRVADSIRKWEPQRVMVIGSNKWQSAATFDQLRIPANDTNIVLSFHFYEPMPLTHYQAGWTEFKDFKGEVNYPGQIVLNTNDPKFQKVYNRDTLLKMMQKPIHLADSLKLPLYCGEFGVYKEFFPAAKLAWYSDMVSIFNQYNIAYANWNYKSDAFGIVDENMTPLVPIIKILTKN